MVDGVDNFDTMFIDEGEKRYTREDGPFMGVKAEVGTSH